MLADVMHKETYFFAVYYLTTENAGIPTWIDLDNVQAPPHCRYLFVFLSFTFIFLGAGLHKGVHIVLCGTYTFYINCS